MVDNRKIKKKITKKTNLFSKKKKYLNFVFLFLGA